MAETMKCRFLRFENPPRRGAVIVSGVGVQEELPPCVVDRPGGTGDRLLMLHEGHIVLDKSGEEKAALKLDDVLGLFNEISIECGN